MSALNCRPGDLAVIVCAMSDPQHLGKIVTCIRWENDEWGGGWHTKPVLRDTHGICIVWHDGDLRPLRHPGDDARDQTLDWIPLPVTTKDAEVSNG